MISRVNAAENVLAFSWRAMISPSNPSLQVLAHKVGGGYKYISVSPRRQATCIDRRLRSSTVHSTSVRCRIESSGYSSSVVAPSSSAPAGRPSPSPPLPPRRRLGPACTDTSTRPAACLGTNSRSSLECDGPSDPVSRFQCEPLAVSPALPPGPPPPPPPPPPVLLRPVPPIVMSPDALDCEYPLDAPLVDGQADFQTSRTRGPFGEQS